jgi:DNA mismatch repair protein MutS
MALTPMMQQWRRLKDQVPEALLLFRLGDFYELFYEDAQVAAPVLDLVLTSRDGAPMCGVPHHALEGHVARLLQRGFKVAVAEQVEDPALARGLVRREVVRVVTPGTATEGAFLDERTPNWCCALNGERQLAALDASTGELRTARLGDWDAVRDELARLRPREILLPDGFDPPLDLGGTAVTRRPFPGDAAEALLAYLRETQRGEPAQVTAAAAYDPEGFLQLDAAAQRNLELVRRLSDGSAAGTLLAAVDHTLTAMGARCLREWCLRPLLDPRAIARRQDAVEALVRQPLFREALRRALRGVYDLERLTARVAVGRAGPRDLLALGRSLAALPAVCEALAGALPDWAGRIDPVPEVAALLERALGEDGSIRTGFDQRLDELRAAARDGQQRLAELEARERERTGIRSLKVGFNRVFGYYLEVSRANRNLVPQDWTRKQTLAGAERFVTPELKAWEERILGAEERAARLEAALLAELQASVAAHTARLQATARAVAECDALASLAEAADRGGWVRPVVDDSLEIRIRAGRHPVLDSPGRFVPNDAHLGEERRFCLITGPNMAGKSTYMRQVALLVILAQMGSFVPAAEARIGVVDRIFTRVGASDDLAGGRSTFMVEMTEVAELLRRATPRSLLLLDEVGRGTSTLDGLAIAWAVAEDVARRIRARTLFATHFHELTAVVPRLPGAVNLHVAVLERGEEVVFLHRIVPGASDRSYGIHVARLAGLPEPVLARAAEVLRDLEAGGGVAVSLAVGEGAPPDRAAAGPAGGDAGGASEPPPGAGGLRVLERLAAVDPLRTTPMEALQLLWELAPAAAAAVGGSPAAPGGDGLPRPAPDGRGTG